jgi:UDP-N-acetylmuramoyl-L-alanyl-D-glutamate--2,6-diaminopimelate ligase
MAAMTQGPKRLRGLLRGIDVPPQGRDLLICGIQHDSRLVQPRDLFVAIRGHLRDGHSFIAEAIARGAVAVVGERTDLDLPVPYITVEDSRKALAELASAFYDYPTRELFTVGITGTKGKTSVAHLCAAVLGQAQTELISTITNSLERGRDQTTPEPPQIQRLARRALSQGKHNLVLEVSAHALSQERVHGVDFDVAIFTNLSHDHLDYFGDMESYLQAKLRLFTELKPEATALINRDDPVSIRVQRATRARVLTYGLTPQAEIWVEDIKLDPQGFRAEVHTPRGSFVLELSLLGRFAVTNALAAVGVGLARGLPLKLIWERLMTVTHIEGRMECYSTAQGFTVVVDFAHSPASLEEAIKSIKPFYKRVITLFGCGGDSDRLKRPIMGRISGRLSDYTIITSDNPKSEDPLAIISQIEAGLKSTGSHYEAIPDRRAAIRRALELARPGDCILIAGKGHERTQIFHDREVPFNDVASLRDLSVIHPHDEARAGL